MEGGGRIGWPILHKIDGASSISFGEPRSAPPTGANHGAIAQKFGDDSFAFRLSSDNGPATFSADFLFVRTGGSVVSVGSGGLTGAEPGLLEQLGDAAVAKVAAAATGTTGTGLTA